MKIIVSDIDGCLTDGTVTVDQNGIESCTYSRIDGHGIKLAQESGFTVALLTAERNNCHKHRAEKLGVDLEVTDDKSYIFSVWIKDVINNAYFGDDIADLEAMKKARMVGCPFDANEMILIYVLSQGVNGFVSKRRAGKGAFRDFVDYIIDKWPS